MEEVKKVLDALVGKMSFIQSRQEQIEIVKKTVDSIYPHLTDEEKKKMTERVFGYDLVEDLVHDPCVEDIIVNGLNHVFIAHSKQGMVRLDRRFESLDDLDIFIEKLIIFSGKKRRENIMDMHLPEGGRVNIVNSPYGPQVTIRKFRKKPMSIIELIDMDMFDFNLAAQLWLYTEGFGVKPANILVGGIPGAGKTTLLNSLFSFFPPNERIVVIEDTLELNTEYQENCSRLEATEETGMGVMVKNSLRMRPDRIIIGEVRGEEAIHMMTAMNIGKITMGTIHAGSTREVVMRLQHAPMNVPSEIMPLVDVIMVVKKVDTKEKSCRKIFEISEVAGLEKNMVLLSDYVKFDPNTGNATEIHPSVVYRDRLAEASGYTPREIMDELEIRKRVLMVLQKAGKRDLGEIAKFCRHYYNNQDEALAMLGYKK